VGVEWNGGFPIIPCNWNFFVGRDTIALGTYLHNTWGLHALKSFEYAWGAIKYFGGISYNLEAFIG
jgi:hypothetical protein